MDDGPYVTWTLQNGRSARVYTTLCVHGDGSLLIVNMVFPIVYKDNDENRKDKEAAEETRRKKKKQQEEQIKAEKGKQPLLDQKANQFPDKIKGKQLATLPPPSSYPPSINRPKIPNKEPASAKSDVLVKTPTQELTIVGPFGNQVGVPWDDETHTTIRQIVIVSAHCIESIHVEYDDNGDSFWSEKRGSGKLYEDEIRLKYPDEFLISVSGYYSSENPRILSLTFYSNKRTYGPYGRENGVYFTFPSTGRKIIGFHGRCNTTLDSIGAYFEPISNSNHKNNGLTSKDLIKNGDVAGPSAEIPISLGPFGGQAGSPWNDGIFTTVRQLVIASDSEIKSIRIEYDKNGSSEWSEEHGECGQHGTNTVHLQYPEEFIMSISGFYTAESIQSLTIQSNRKTYGPFGKEQGIHFSTPSTGGKIIGFHGMCGTNLVSIGAFLEPSFYSYPPTQKLISIGPFGGLGGGYWDNGTFTGVRQLTIASGVVIDSISIEYDKNGCAVKSDRHGGSGGDIKTITLDYPAEFLISVWGRIYDAGSLIIVQSLTFQSNRKTYGPFGLEQGKPFSFPSTSGKIIGFHGKSGQFLDSLGAYLEPIYYLYPSKVLAHAEHATEQAFSAHENNERLSKLTIYGPWGGTGGKTFDDGVFTGVRAIHLTRNGALTSIKVLYDRGGQRVWGTKNGGSFGLRLDKIEFDYPSEVLTHISGYYQSTSFKGPMAITSITFYTTKQTYGPFGTKEGIFFTSDVAEGTIVGFHGRKGKYVTGIGVHVLKE